MSEDFEPLTLEQGRRHVGDEVVFHYFHGDDKVGRISSVGNRFIFVRFGRSIGEACSPERLSLLAGMPTHGRGVSQPQPRDKGLCRSCAAGDHVCSGECICVRRACWEASKAAAASRAGGQAVPGGDN